MVIWVMFTSVQRQCCLVVMDHMFNELAPQVALKHSPRG